MYYRLLLCLLWVLAVQSLPAQDINCPCLEDDCGDILSSYTIIGDEAVVCDGFEFTVSNTSPTNDFDFFIWNWDDGTADTSYTKDPVTHTYFIPDSLVCSDDKTNFTICLVVVRQCSGGYSCHSTQQPVSVIHRPEAFFEAEPQICIDNGLGIQNLSCNGDTFFWDFGDGNTSTQENPNHTYAEPGFYTVTLEVYNECDFDIYTQVIEVVAQPGAGFGSSLTAGDSICAPGIVAFTNQTNQGLSTSTAWSISPADTSLWEFTDTTMSIFSDEIEILFKQAGLYTLELTASNVCGTDTQTEEIRIYEQPLINLIAPPIACDSAIIDLDALSYTALGDLNQFTWTFENGSLPGAQQEDFGTVVFQEPGTVTLEASGPCASLTESVPVTVASTEPISLAGNPVSLCQNAGPVQLQADPPPPEGQWSGPGGAVTAEGLLDPATLAPGTYTFEYHTGGNGCENASAISLTIEPAVTVAINPIAPACEDLTLAPSADYSGNNLSYAWTFEGLSPSNSTDSIPLPIDILQPDTLQVTVAVSGSCGTANDTLTVVVQAPQEVSIDGVLEPLCLGSAPVSLSASVTGGVWEGTGIIDPNNGLFDPQQAGVGGHEVIYTVQEGACTNRDTLSLEVVASATVNATGGTFCEDGGAQQLLAQPAGGIWAGPGVGAGGEFDPLLAGPGSHELVYTFVDTNNCEIQASPTVEVQALPQLSFTPMDSLCTSAVEVDLNSVFEAAADPGNGTFTWSGPGVQGPDGTFNAAGLAPGDYSVAVTYGMEACTVMDSLSFTLYAASPLELTPDTALCISEGEAQLSANLPGGLWSGPGIDSTSGWVSFPESGGTYTFNYEYAAGTNCAQSGTVDLNLVDLSGAITMGEDESVCEGSSAFTLSAAQPANGAWQGPGMVDSIAGTINLQGLPADTTYTYQYCIESDAAEACRACGEKAFTIHPKPVADFGLAGLPCIGEAFLLTDSTQGASAYAWDFGDGNTSAEPSPSHTYDQAGTYDITLEIASGFGCTDGADTTLYITTAPQAAFSLEESEGCAPFELQVSNMSTGDSLQQFWQIEGDTLFGPGLNGVVLDSITTDSVFQIVLTAQNFCGPDTQRAEVLVHPYPLSSFGISADEGCSPHSVDFANTTLGAADDYFWDMGNGNTYTDSLPPEQSYTTSDTVVADYPVTLIATNECGTDTSAQMVTVYPPNVRAFIQLDTLEGCAPLTLTLENYSTPGAQNSWSVESPDGSWSGSAEPDPVFILEAAGVHTIILYADGCGQDTDTAWVEVLPAPEPAFDFSPQACVGQPVSFTNLSAGISGSEWDFGDGATSQATAPEHTYDSAGVYEITLTVYSLINNCPATITGTIEVLGVPEAAFEPSATAGCSPLTVDFTNASSGVGALSFVWEFGDGSSAVFDPAPSHTFTQPGTYAVRLTAMDEQNCFSDTSFLSITVFEDPVSQFAFAQTAFCLGHDTLFLDNQSQNAVSYDWTVFGQAYTMAEPEVVPDAPGEYLIELIARSAQQCTDTSVQMVTFLPSPSAGFSFGPATGCQDLEVAFDNTSVDADTYSWDFQNGNSSTAASPSQVFTAPGTYPVQLIAYHFNGCPPDTAVQNVEVWPKPIADFSFDQPDNCGAPKTIEFTNFSEGNINNQWDFGDGASATGTQASHLFENEGQYPVTLLVENSYGCRDSLTQVIDILGKPEAALQLSTNRGCQPLYVEGNNLSQQAQSYIWSVESLPPLEVNSPAFTLPEAGTYDVQLVAIYNDRCVDTLLLKDAIEVYQRPKASFDYTVDPLESVLGDVAFHNGSEQANRFHWDLGDGQSTTVYEPVHQYDFNGEIEVRLTAFNDNGGLWTCEDDTTQALTPEWITTFHAPNALSPEYGTEGVRHFKPVGIGIEEYAIAIYSPYGQQVWYSEALENHQPAEAWDGTYKGELLPQGVYTWKAEMTFLSGERRRRTGTVTLLR